MHEAINQNRTTAKAEDQETISQGKERLLACLLQTKKNMCGRLILRARGRAALPKSLCGSPPVWRFLLPQLIIGHLYFTRRKTMKPIFIIIASIAVIGLCCVMSLSVLPVANADNEVAQVQAGEQTTTFSIEKMTCAMCPITVRKAMERVDGVKSVKVDFDSKTAVVVFDPSVATADEIAAASSSVGYPATAVG